MKTVTILGGGAFGTAFSTLLAENGYTVNLWCKEQEVVTSINENKVNHTFLPGVALPAGIVATDSLETALKGTEWVFIAVPVNFLRSVLQDAKPYLGDSKYVLLSKGIEQESLKLPFQIVEDVLGSKKVVALAGPNFAKELADKQYSGAVAASRDKELALSLRDMVKSFYFRVNVSQDLIGVQVSSAFKNIIAIMSGMLAGSGFENNTRALVLNLGLNEIARIVESLGGRLDTVYGLAGLGDLILTCSSEQSRNFQLGMSLGRGELHPSIMAEGANTIKSLKDIMQKHNLKLPVCEGVYKIMFKDSRVQDVMDFIMRS